ncbi:hypothetical protein [Reyranella soli]|uniref:hypothetical protein n=1 Tax=Reyranella soli TaxID=1230389 RepID=UPI0011BFAAFB|nr:hypothetical protein [Reyranella soli]
MAEPATSDQELSRAALAQRISKLLAALERAKRQPNRREAYHLREALEMIENERYVDAEAAVIKAEHLAPLPAHVAKLVPTNNVWGIKQIREALDRLEGREQ